MKNDFRVKQFRYSADNLGYALYGREKALLIDPGPIGAVMDFLKEKRLHADYVALTHHHPDHKVGLPEILSKTGALFLDPAGFSQTTDFSLESEKLSVIPTPGHSGDSVCCYSPPYLFTGDTLFNFTIGNCFTNDLKTFFRSLNTLAGLPAETIVYAGHDYMEESLAFAKKITPENPHIKTCKKRYDPAHVFSTLEWELLVNPYLRFNDPEMTAVLKKHNLKTDTPFDRFESIYSIE